MGRFLSHLQLIGSTMSPSQKSLSISGATRIVGLIADPVQQVRTPQLLNALFSQKRIDAVAVALHVAAGGLPGAWQGLARIHNLAGFVVSIPHKIEAAPLCDALGPQARLAGTVNTVRREPDGRMIGETFDGTGFVAGLREAGFDPAGRTALLLGAGGAAVSIAFALAASGLRTLSIRNRTVTKARELAGRLRATFPDIEITTGDRPPDEADLIVNATPLGAGSEGYWTGRLPAIGRDTWVAEALMARELTPLALLAQQQGARFLDGRVMLAGQIDLILRHILPDIPAPILPPHRIPTMR
jgi:shikimate dehydrogenase